MSVTPEKIVVRPGPGRRVRLDDGRRLTPETTPAEGVRLPWSIYLQRRLDCGDLILVASDGRSKDGAAETSPPKVTTAPALKTDN